MSEPENGSQQRDQTTAGNPKSNANQPWPSTPPDAKHEAEAGEGLLALIDRSIDQLVDLTQRTCDTKLKYALARQKPIQHHHLAMKAHELKLAFAIQSPTPTPPLGCRTHATNANQHPPQTRKGKGRDRTHGRNHHRHTRDSSNP